MNRLFATVAILAYAAVACTEQTATGAAQTAPAVLAPAVAKPALAQAAPAPAATQDGQAMLAAANAQLTSEALLTAAATATLGSQRATATQARVATLETIQDLQTISVISVTLVFVQRAQATDTQQVRAAGTATAMREAEMTPTAQALAAKAAADAAWDDGSRAAWWWFGFIAAGVAMIVILAGAGRWMGSKAIEAEKRGEAAVCMANAEAAAIRAESEAKARHMMRRAYQVGNKFIIEDEHGVEHHPIAPVIINPGAAGRAVTVYDGPPVSPITDVERTPDQEAMLLFLQAAIDSAANNGRSGYIPTDSDMGYGGGDWTMYVAELKHAGLVITRSGRPKAGGYGTMLSGRYQTLRALKEAVERGLVDFPGLAQKRSEKRSENVPNVPLERFSEENRPAFERGGVLDQGAPAHG